MIVRLLGPPMIEHDGGPLPGPRGYKAWGLLAYLALAEAAPSRQRLVNLLFEEANDPRRALRWNLTVDGDPVVLEVADGHHIDAQLVTRKASAGTLEACSTGGELLEGMVFDDSPCFEAWLTAERHRLAADSRALVSEQALRLLATGRPGDAARTAARAVELDPLNGDYHAVLLTSLVRAGDVTGARHHAADCADLFRRELGIDPPAAIARAMLAAVPAPAGGPLSAAVVRSYLDAGTASMSVGSVTVGLRQLRDAVRASTADNATVGDVLAGQSQLALAGALIHGTGGRGAEEATLLHAALEAAARAGDQRTGAAACRELGFLAVQLGERGAAEHWLARAEEACTDDEERARVLGVRGMGQSDAASYADALDTLDVSIEHATRVGARRQRAWSTSMIGRVHLLRGEPSLAIEALDSALDDARAERWTAFLPWPEALRAEAALDVGDVDDARDLLEHAWILASESGDRCWIATVAHGLARLVAARDDARAAVDWCHTGLEPRPGYSWLTARLLDVGCEITIPWAPALARQWAGQLAELSACGAMHELTARAHLHRARLGDHRAIEAARSAAEDIDNPAFRKVLA